MKAIRLEKPKHLVKLEIDEPRPPGHGQAMVRTHQMGICGTDYSGYLGKFPFFQYPRIPGHELGLEVLEVGDGVINVKAGDHCSIEPYMNCGACFSCRKGRINCCENLNVIGVMIDGGLCERFLVRADKLHPSKTLSFEQLALVETLGIGCHATNRGEAGEGDQVLVIGAGPIGLATIEFTRLTGATITVMDIIESRLQFCRETYGVPHTVVFKGDGSEQDEMEEITGGDMYSLVTDATGSSQSMSHAVNYVAHAGSLIYLGVSTNEIAFPHRHLHLREMQIRSSRNAMPCDFTHVIGLIEDGKVDTNPWITHRIPFDDVITEFEGLTRPESGVIKAMIEVA